jgi:heptosyltransferase-2
MIKTDCIHFPLDRPCRFHKEKGIKCGTCGHYVPVAAPAGAVKEILIIKLGAMGDVLRTTFLLPGLKKKYPRSRITWVVAAGSTAVLEGNPFLSAVVPMNDRVYSLLSAKKFDIVINLDLAPVSISLATLAMARKRIGYWLNEERQVQCSNTFAREWLSMSAFDDLKKANTRTYQYWMAKIAGLPRADYEIFTPLAADAVARAAAFAHRHKIGRKPVVGINPGAGGRWQLKKWSDRGYGGLLKRCADAGYTVLLYGGPEEEKLLASYLRKAKGAAVSTGTANALPDFFALLDLCDVLITGDTMAMHAALGLKKKVVAIFGPTSAAEIELYGRGQKVISPVSCACCYRPECPVTPNCMEQIPVDAVWNALNDLVKGK